MVYDFNTLGVVSETKDGNHILMLDIDNEIDLDKLNIFLLNIMEKCNLTFLYVIKSNHGFNIASLDKFNIKLYDKISILCGDYVDKDYLRLGRQRGYYALRIGIDKEFIKFIINDNNNLYCYSNAHRIFFNAMFGLNIRYSSLFDNYDNIQLVKYNSDKIQLVKYNSDM